MNVHIEEVDLGTLELGKRVRISDPCYSLNTWCAGVIENVLPGKYLAKMIISDELNWGKRVKSIEVFLEGTSVPPTIDSKIDVGVDSGQCGIYDEEYYSKFHNDSEREHVDDNWYDRVGELTYKNQKNPNYLSQNDWVAKRTGQTLDRLLSGDLSSEERNFLLNDSPSLPELLSEYLRSSDSHEYIGQFYGAVIDNAGVVSSSGHGDGSYTCLLGYTGEYVTSIGVYFLEEESECDDTDLDDDSDDPL